MKKTALQQAFEAAKFRPLTRDEVQIKVRNEPEDYSFEEAFDDAENVSWIRDQLQAGNDWAWCTAFVQVCWGDFAVEANLGGCSYESEEDFRKSGDYLDDMVDDALKELNSKLQIIADQIIPRLDS